MSPVTYLLFPWISISHEGASLTHSWQVLLVPSMESCFAVLRTLEIPARLTSVNVAGSALLLFSPDIFSEALHQATPFTGTLNHQQPPQSLHWHPFLQTTQLQLPDSSICHSSTNVLSNRRSGRFPLFTCMDSSGRYNSDRIFGPLKEGFSACLRKGFRPVK